MSEKANSAQGQIMKRIRSRGRGWVFTPRDFEDLCVRSTISTSLQRLHESGMIRQLARGLYDYPKTDKQLGELAAPTDDIAKALAGRDAIRLQPSGAYAANLLGLSTQVPMRIVYLTDGRSRTVQVGRRQIILKQTSPRIMATAGRISGLVIQALRYLGQAHVDEGVIAGLDRRLDDDARRQLIKDIRFAPAWIAEIFRRLAAGEGS
jgi:predicted transcriptional regulator of viral defense system